MGVNRTGNPNPNFPSTTGNPSGKHRGNNPPSSSGQRGGSHSPSSGGQRGGTGHSKGGSR